MLFWKKMLSLKSSVFYYFAQSFWERRQMRLHLDLGSVAKAALVTLGWSLVVASMVTPRICYRIEYSLEHGGSSEPFGVPYLDWPQLVLLTLATLLMGMLIADFTMFLVGYLVGLSFSSVLMYVLVNLPVYSNIITSEHPSFYAFSDLAINFIARCLLIAPVVGLLFAGVIGVFVGEAKLIE